MRSLRIPLRGDENVALATHKGRALLFHISEVPPKASAIRGVNAIKLESGDRVLGFALTQRKRNGLTVWTSRGRELVIRETSYRPTRRGGKGAVVLRVGSLIKCHWPPSVAQPSVEDDTLARENSSDE